MKRFDVLLSLFLISGTGLSAQAGSSALAVPKIPRDPPFYLYNPRLDGLGQDLEKAAGAVTNGQIFESQLTNLEAISRLATERIFSSGRRAALARIESIRKWDSVWNRVSEVKTRALPNDAQRADWERQIGVLKCKLDQAQKAAESASAKLKPFADLLEEVGRAQQVIEAGKFLQQRKVADINTTDLRVVAKLQEAVESVGTLLNGIASQPKLASTRSAAEQMKVDLAKAEMDHIKALTRIEEKRLDGQKDVRSVLTAIEKTLICVRPDGVANWNCTLTFTDNDRTFTESLRSDEQIEATLDRFQHDPLKLKSVVYLLENFAALAARADLPVRLSELRASIEDRRFAIRRDAIMARTYEHIVLIGAQRIATYYKGGVKPETLAQFANALTTAGLIPTIALK